MRVQQVLAVAILVWFGIVLPTPGRAQVVQWASRVVGFSSEGRVTTDRGEGRQLRAVQALGSPSKLPQLGESPCAWSPMYPDGGDEWLHVAFAKPMPVRQVVIAENVNPGAITRVVILDGKGREYPVYENKTPGPRSDGLLRIFPQDSTIVGTEVKVYLNTTGLRGPNQIDAVGLSDGVTPIQAVVKVSKDTPKEIQKENLGKLVNTAGQEVAPVIAPDGRTLYFTRNFNKANIGGANKQDVWYSSLESSGPGQPTRWGEAINIGSPINNGGDNAISGMAPDGRTIYLINVYKPDGGLSFGISKATKGKTGWGQPVECIIKNNYNTHVDNQLEFSVSPDGKTMVLAVQRKDTEGNRDLYVSFRQPDQSWSEPKTLGPVLNTADFESSPFIAADSRTLYFTSGGHPGFGNGDIYVTRRQDDSWTRWSEPENLGPAINTAEWDGYFTIPASGDFAYLSSRANTLGEDDIFRLKLYAAIKPDPVAIVSGKVLDAISRKPVSSSVASELFQENKEQQQVEYDPETGEYKMILPTQKTYTLSANKEGYFPTTETLDLSKDKRFRDIKRNLYVIPIVAGAKIVMREVLFEQGKFDLVTGANAELDRVFEMMGKYPQMELLIEGHTDNQGEWEPNMKLSEDRVRVVKEYLTGKGIVPERIQTKAWGPSKPIANNESEERRKLNRRVEFTIVKL